MKWARCNWLQVGSRKASGSAAAGSTTSSSSAGVVAAPSGQPTSASAASRTGRMPRTDPPARATVHTPHPTLSRRDAPRASAAASSASASRMGAPSVPAKRPQLAPAGRVQAEQPAGAGARAAARGLATKTAQRSAAFRARARSHRVPRIECDLRLARCRCPRHRLGQKREHLKSPSPLAGSRRRSRPVRCHSCPGQGRQVQCARPKTSTMESRLPRPGCVASALCYRSGQCLLQAQQKRRTGCRPRNRSPRKHWLATRAVPGACPSRRSPTRWPGKSSQHGARSDQVGRRDCEESLTDRSRPRHRLRPAGAPA